MFPHHQGGGRNSSALQIKQEKIFQTERSSQLGDKQGVSSVPGRKEVCSGEGRVRGSEPGQHWGRGRAGEGGSASARGHAPQALFVWGNVGALCFAPSFPHAPVQFLLTPAGHRPGPEEHPHSCTGRRDGSRRRCLIPSAEQGSSARKGKGRQGGGPGAPGTGEGSAWPDVAGWLRGERSRALGTVCPTPLRKH